jgi:uncharacterized protein YdeI (YjbR/CyaY-like superfamily)
VNRWREALVALRAQLRATDLVETLKWGNPCYTLDGKNVVMLSAYNEHATVSFFKGALLEDPEGRLEAAGPSSQAARLLRFTSAAEVEARREATSDLVRQAIDVERRGLRVVFAGIPEPMPEALQEALDADPALAAAFDALTPGRQRSYILHVSGAKQVGTQRARAAKCAPKIMAGKGFNER